MSYSPSEKSVQKVEAFLQALCNLKGDSISWTTADPNKLAYQIRQGLTVAEVFDQKYPAYSGLKEVFRIKVKQNIVTAVRIVPLVEQQEELTAQNFVKTVQVFTITDVKEPLAVISSLLEFPNFQEYSFPDYTEPTELELNQIYKWTSKNAHYIVKSKNLVITKQQPPEDLAWSPKLRAI